MAQGSRINEMEVVVEIEVALCPEAMFAKAEQDSDGFREALRGAADRMVNDKYGHVMKVDGLKMDLHPTGPYVISLAHSDEDAGSFGFQYKMRA